MEELIICRCEEVTLEDIQKTVEKYNGSAREVKLRTRVGMGYCGGRTCRPLIDGLLQKILDEQPEDDIPLKVQPPVRPTSLARLGGESNEE